LGISGLVQLVTAVQLTCTTARLGREQLRDFFDVLHAHGQHVLLSLLAMFCGVG